MLRIPRLPLKRARPHAAALADTPLVDVQINAELWDRPAPDHPWPRHTLTATEPLPSHLRGIHAHEQVDTVAMQRAQSALQHCRPQAFHKQGSKRTRWPTRLKAPLLMRPRAAQLPRHFAL